MSAPSAPRAIVRKPKNLTKERMEAIAALIVKDGLLAVRAAALCGVSERAHYEWMQKGKVDSDGENNLNSIYAEYVLAIHQAEAHIQQSWMREIREHDGVRWQRLAWLLERRFRDEFSLFHGKEKKEETPANTVVIVTDGAQAAI